MLGIGPWEWFIVLVLALVVVGPRRLPDVARTLGRVATEVRRTTFDLRRTLEDELESEDRERRRTEARERRILRDEELAKSGQTIPRPAVEPVVAQSEDLSAIDEGPDSTTDAVGADVTGEPSSSDTGAATEGLSDQAVGNQEAARGESA